MNCRLLYYCAFWSVLIGVFCFTNLKAQLCQDLNVSDANGNTAIPIDCAYPLDANQCFTLQADYVDLFSSATYDLSTVTYNLPVPINSGTVINENVADDTWGEVINLPFEFCFFDNTFDQIIVSDNGLVSFNTSLSGGSSVFTAASLPNSSLYKNTIYVAYHDLTNNDSVIGCDDDPSTPENECGDIRITTLGTAPCRQFVVNFNNLNHFGCTQTRSSFQLVLFESTNEIQINIKDKPINCEIEAPNNAYRKRATIGIMNQDGSIAYSPTDRNAAIFSAVEESYLFSPNAGSIASLEWTDQDGNILGTNPSLQICDINSNIYTATLSYDFCGTITQLSESIPVELSPDFPIAENITISPCDNFSDNVEDLNLNDYIDQVNANFSLFNVSYHHSMAEAQSGANAIANPSSLSVSNGDTIFVRIENNPNCFAIGVLTVEFNDPIPLSDSSFTICDVGFDNLENVTLGDYNNQIISNSNQYQIDYYGSNADAENEMNVITDLELNSPSTTVYVRVNNGDCYNIAAIEFILAPKPLMNDIVLEDICELSTYNLAQNISNIISNPSNFEISYHPSLNSANNLNANGFVGSVVIDQNVYYVRAIDPNSGCYSISQITINYTELQPTRNYQLLQCDTNGDELESFDLNSAIPDITFGNPDFAYEFFNSFIAARNNDSSELIPEPLRSNFPVNYPNASVFVRLEDTNTGCISIKELELIVSKIPEPLEEDINVCDDDSDPGIINFDLSSLQNAVLWDISQNLTFYFIEYYATADDANNQQNEIEVFDVTGTHTLYVRIFAGFPLEDQNGDPILDSNGDPTYFEGCSMIFPIVIELAGFNEYVEGPFPLCDFENNGLERVNLTDYTGDYTSNPDYSNFQYRSWNNTSLNVNQASNFILNINNPYFFLTFEDLNGCTIRVRYNFDFINGPELNNFTAEICDFGMDDAEVINLFDFGSNFVSNPADFTFSFYNSEAAANALNPAGLISNPDSYSVSDNDFVYVNVENNETGCRNVAKLTFNFEQAPVLETDVFVCSDEGGATFFPNYDLSNFDSALIDNYQDYDFSYYLTYLDAFGNINEVTNADIGSSPITLFVRSISELGCIGIQEIQASIYAKPALNTDITFCDNNNEGEQLILYNELNELIVANAGQYSFTYFQSLNDLQNNNNPISDTTEHTLISGSSVFARVEYNSSCFDLVEVTITLYPGIPVNNYTYSICDLDNNLEENFDLELYLTELNNDFANYEITYFTDEEAANDKNSSFQIVSNINNYYSNLEFNTIFVRFENQQTACYSVAKLILNIATVPKVINAQINACDENFDNAFDVDLETLPPLIIDSGNSSLLTFSYHTSYLDAENNINALNPAFNYFNPNSNFSIFVRVENTVGCYAVAEVMVSGQSKNEVNPIPGISICDTGNDMQEWVDLTQNENSINTNASSFIYYPTFLDMIEFTNSISNPSAYNLNSASGTIYVRVQENGLCDNYVALDYELLPVPTSYHPDVYKICPDETVLISVQEGYASYFWEETSETTSSITVDQVGTYHVEITGFNGCTNTYEIQVMEHEAPNISINEISEGTIQITNHNLLDILEYSIDGVNFQALNIFQNLPPGLLTLYYRNINTNCVYEMEFLVLRISNTITPNGDGINDTWKINDLSYFGGKEALVEIYDRYGKKLYSVSSNTTVEWDGRYLGRTLNTGSYWYIVQLPDGKKYSGYIFIKNFDSPN